MIARSDTWEGAVPQSLVSTSAPSNFSSSPPSSFCSPVFSPMDIAASSFGADWTSSCSLWGSPFSATRDGVSASSSLALVPPTFQPAPLDEHLEAFLAGSSPLERVPSRVGKAQSAPQAGDARFDPLGTSIRVRRGLSASSSSTSPDIPVRPALTLEVILLRTDSSLPRRSHWSSSRRRARRALARAGQGRLAEPSRARRAQLRSRRTTSTCLQSSSRCVAVAPHSLLAQTRG